MRGLVHGHRAELTWEPSSPGPPCRCTQQCSRMQGYLWAGARWSGRPHPQTCLVASGTWGVLVPLRDASLEFTSDPETPGALATSSPTTPFRKEDSFRRLRQPGGVPRASDNVCLTQNTDWNEAVRTAGRGSWGCLDASVCYVPVRAPLRGTPAVTWPCFSMAITGRVGERMWEQLSVLKGGGHSAHAALKLEGCPGPRTAVLVSFPAVATCGSRVSWGLSQGPRATPVPAAGAPVTCQDRNSTSFVCPERAWDGLRGCSVSPSFSLLTRAWPCPVPAPQLP